jgi:DNA-binding transcriptional regulator YiaG
MSRNSPPDLESARRFRALLDRLAISQSDLARELEMPPNTISRWATGRQAPVKVVWAYLELRAKLEEMVRRK